MKNAQETLFHVCVYGHQLQQTEHKPGMVANPFLGQLNVEKGNLPVPVRARGLISRVRLSCPEFDRQNDTM